MNQPRDERPLYGQGCLFAAMLVIAASYRNFWISRFEGWHVLPSRGYAKRFRDSRSRGRRQSLPSVPTIADTRRHPPHGRPPLPAHGHAGHGFSRRQPDHRICAVSLVHPSSHYSGPCGDRQSHLRLWKIAGQTPDRLNDEKWYRDIGPVRLLRFSFRGRRALVVLMFPLFIVYPFPPDHKAILMIQFRRRRVQTEYQTSCVHLSGPLLADLVFAPVMRLLLLQ
jgi:hypothetical protein